MKKHTLYNITHLLKTNPIYEESYIGLYFYIDNQDTWLYRVFKGNYDEEKEGEYTLERNNFDIEVTNYADVKEFVENDDLSNWDYKVYTTLEELMEEGLKQGNEIDTTFLR